MRHTKIAPESVVGIGTDFTSCTVLPTYADGTPLRFDGRWAKHPHAWIKLWKHHAARLKPGENGLIALDWWNGNRSVLMNANLSGVLVGLTLQTSAAPSAW